MNKPFALIIEDDTHLGRILALTLQAHCETEIVTNGSVALARLAEVVPSIIVLDLNLPGKGGKDILYWVRKDHRFDRTRIFICTADAVQANMLQDEADIVLLKPVSPAQLQEMAVRFLKSQDAMAPGVA